MNYVLYTPFNCHDVFRYLMILTFSFLSQTLTKNLQKKQTQQQISSYLSPEITVLENKTPYSLIPYVK